MGGRQERRRLAHKSRLTLPAVFTAKRSEALYKPPAYVTRVDSLPGPHFEHLDTGSKDTRFP